jgi:hypothetical protein
LKQPSWRANIPAHEGLKIHLSEPGLLGGELRAPTPAFLAGVMISTKDIIDRQNSSRCFPVSLVPSGDAPKAAQDLAAATSHGAVAVL